MLDDLTNLQALLKDSTLLATKGYIAGEWCDGENGQTFPVYNPARGDVITDVADISRTQAAEAISISEKLLIFSKNTFLNFSASIFGS